MKYEKWTNEKLSKYCKFILGYRVRVIYLPRFKKQATMIAFPYCRTLIRCFNYFPKCLVWHECGHLHQAESFIELIKSLHGKIPVVSKEDYSELNLYTFDEKKDYEKKCGKKLFKQYVENEVNAHLWAYKSAKDRGFNNIADDLIKAMDLCDFDGSDIYREAKKKIMMSINKKG